MSTELAQRIREARERAGLTQQQVGARVGVSLRTVGNWERGETVPMNRLARLESVLGTNLRADAPADEPASATLTAEALPAGFERLTPRQQEAVNAVVQAMLDPADQDQRPTGGGRVVDLARPQLPDLTQVAARRGESEGRRLVESQDREGETPE